MNAPSLAGAMVSWLPHLFVPAMFALAFLTQLPRRWVMWTAPLVWVPDLDYFSPGGHRVLTHNIWIPLALLGAALLWWKRQPTIRFWDAMLKPGWGLFFLLASYYWASHVFLDIFAGGVVLFWPLTITNFYAFFEIHTNLQTGTVQPIEEVGTEQGAPTLSNDYTWLSFEHTATLAFLALAGLVALGNWWYRRRAKRAAEASAP
jgi:hypothetical protein